VYCVNTIVCFLFVYYSVDLFFTANVYLLAESVFTQTKLTVWKAVSLQKSRDKYFHGEKNKSFWPVWLNPLTKTLLILVQFI